MIRRNLRRAARSAQAPVATPAPKITQRNGRTGPPARTARPSTVNDSRIRLPPAIAAPHSAGRNETATPRARARSSSVAPRISPPLTRIGASTGPTHGTGMRNRMSGVMSDAGHPSATRSQT